MSGYSERIVIARRAWRSDLPEDAEVRDGALRIARRMRRTRQRALPRRTVTLVAAALVLLGALAYAASGRHRGGWLLLERGDVAGDGTGPRLDPTVGRVGATAGARARAAVDERSRTARDGREPRPDDVAAPEAEAGAASSTSVAEELADRTRAIEGASARRAESLPGDTPSAVDVRAARWRAVSAALARDDARAAEQALRDLDRSSDAATRAKAKLGLARLALAEGDRARARRLAEEVARTDGLDPSLAARAFRLLGQIDEPER